MKYYHNVSIKKYSYIKVGGKVSSLFLCENEKDLLKAYKKDVRIVGGGSKILFAFEEDKGKYILDRNEYILDAGNRLIIGSGTPLAKIGNYFEKNGWKGFSKIRTIPGRLGGSLVQNASCYGEQISDYLLSILCYDGEKIFRLYKAEGDFSYRNSYFKNHSVVILHAEFRKEKEEISVLKKNYREAKKNREFTQPTEKKTLGSTFCNYHGFSAGKILDSLNLKGFSIQNGARVSTKHANFIEIEKDCFYPAISLLIRHLRIVLYKKTGINFPLEIVIFGRKEDGGKSSKGNCNGEME